MTISLTLRRWGHWLAEPARLYSGWHRRLARQADLRRLLENDDHLLNDVGFSRQSVERELRRLPWERPVNLRQF